MYGKTPFQFLTSGLPGLSSLVTAAEFFKHFISHFITFLWWKDVRDQVYTVNKAVGRKYVLWFVVLQPFLSLNVEVRVTAGKSLRVPFSILLSMY